MVVNMIECDTTILTRIVANSMVSMIIFGRAVNVENHLTRGRGVASPPYR